MNQPELQTQAHPVTLSALRLREDAVLPRQMTAGAAACDLTAAFAPRLDGSDSGCGEAVTIQPGRSAKIPTGLAVAIPAGFGGFLFARSSLGTKYNIVPANCVGVIDSDYRGEIFVTLLNQGQADFTVRPGDRIAQLAILPVMQQQWVECESLDETARGTGGFGSTGR